MENSQHVTFIEKTTHEHGVTEAYVALDGIITGKKKTFYPSDIDHITIGKWVHEASLNIISTPKKQHPIIIRYIGQAKNGINIHFFKNEGTTVSDYPITTDPYTFFDTSQFHE